MLLPRRLWIAGAAVILSALVVPSVCGAQTSDNGATPPGEEEQAAALAQHLTTLPVRDAGEMKAADRDLLQQREMDVSKAAAFYGFDISDSRWSYHQIVCRSLPGQLLLSFQNDSAERGASHFVAVVPANGEKVQVVTEYAHGLLPFRAAWEKSAAYEAFNHMAEADRGSSPLGSDSHWLNLGMCFVALTGRVPQVPIPEQNVAASEALAKRSGSTPIIEIQQDRGAEVRFSDVSDPRRTGNWELRFDARGRLTKAIVESLPPVKTKQAPLSPIIPKIEPE